MMVTFSRRQFIRSVLLSGASLLSAGSLGFGGIFSSKATPSIHQRRVLADLHVHPMLDAWIERSPLAVKFPFLAKIAETEFNPTYVKWKACHRAGIDLMCVAHFNVFDEWLSMPTDPNPEAPANTIYMMDLLEQELNYPAAPYAQLARNHKELSKILQIRRGDKGYRIAVLHALEGGHALGGSLKSLECFARRGVALITITHFFNKGIASSPNAYPFFPDASSRWSNQGLSEFGAEVIKEMEKHGIIVDVTHATSAAVADILRVAKKPLVATHSSVRTLGDHPYSLFDEHIQEIARGGGIIGIILYPYMLSNYGGVKAAKNHGSLRDAVRSIRYVAKICGTHKHIGIGSDFAGYIDGPKEMTQLDEIDKLRQLLIKEFDKDETIVEDIMANNAIDFICKNWRSGLGSKIKCE
jgi:microsomal dipeptidase-like Zn-dependent dipeptidase